MNVLALVIEEDPVIYVRISLALCCVGGLIASLEFLTVLPAFAPKGLYSWLVLRCEQVRRLGLRLQPAGFESLGSTTAVGALLTVRVAMLAVLPFLPVQTMAFAIAACAACFVTMVFTWRRFIGDDGSDQMTTIILVTMALSAGLGRGTVALALGLWFLAFQACLSYAAAGLAKAFSREWRDGSAIFKIFNTEAYGLRSIAALLRGRRALGLMAAWSVIIVECAFPLVVIAPFPLMVVLLSLGMLFHLLCAVIMGLNSFLWAFVATYPALVFANHCVRSAMTG